MLRAELAAHGRAVALVVLADEPSAILRPVDGARMERVASALRGFAGRVDPAHVHVRRAFLTIPAAVVDLDEDGLRALLGDDRIALVEPDLPGGPALAESVPLIRADKLQMQGHSGAGIGVAILDTGINAAHEDFAGALLGNGFHSINQGADTGEGQFDDDVGHGTNVAGIVGARGVVSHAGVAPASQLFIAKVLTPNGGFASDWAIAIDYVTAHRNDFAVPLKVINMSLLTYATDMRCNCDDGQATMFMASQAAKSSGFTIFAASGNSGLTDAVGYPACYSTVLPIGATYDSDYGRSPDVTDYQTKYGSDFAACFDQTAAKKLTCFTNRFQCLQLVAPGAAITAPYIGSPTAIGTYYGTSQATPHASGVAAQILSHFPSLTPDQVYSSLLASQQPMVDDPVLNTSYLFLDALDADAAATCLSTCAAAGPCETAACDLSTVTCKHTPLAAGQSCGAAVCIAGMLNSTGTCDGSHATCGAAVSCGDYQCNGAKTACLTNCSSDGDCRNGKVCVVNACTMPPMTNMPMPSSPSGCAIARRTPRALPLFALLLALVALRRKWGI
jgi:hypothetical protein